MDKKLIGEVFNKHKTDKGPWRHGYHQCYGDLFSDFTPTKMLEIGVMEGRSLAAWRELFPQATIHGAELREWQMVEAAKDIPLFRGHSSDPEFAKTLFDDYDVIIDDGDHRPDAQWGTFLNFKDKWKKYYVIEDVINEDMEQLLRRRFKAAGYSNVTTYRSAFRGPVRINKVMVDSAFFVMVIRKND